MVDLTVDELFTILRMKYISTLISNVRRYETLCDHMSV